MDNLSRTITSLADGLRKLAVRVERLEVKRFLTAGGIPTPSEVMVEDEGVPKGLSDTLDFVGLGVTAAVVGTEATITIPGGHYVSEGPGIDIVSGATEQIGIGGDTILLYDSGGLPVAEYAATHVGLVSALAAFTAGDMVSLPSVTITLTGNLTIPSNARIVGISKNGAIINTDGYVIQHGSGAWIRDVTILVNKSSAGEIVPVKNSVTGIAYMEHVDILATNSGAGNCVAVSCENALVSGNGEIHLKDCILQGYATGGGSGYCGRSSAGKLVVIHSRGAYFTTDRFIVV